MLKLQKHPTFACRWINACISSLTHKYRCGKAAPDVSMIYLPNLLITFIRPTLKLSLVCLKSHMTAARERESCLHIGRRAFRNKGTVVHRTSPARMYAGPNQSLNVQDPTYAGIWCPVG